jgi:DinB superfamily
MTEDLRFPTGKFHFNPDITTQTRARAIDAIRRTPSALRAAVDGLTDARLDTPYRPGGWTVRQLVHHVPESHMNAFVRFKLALTEDNPTIKPYDEDRWANTKDVKGAIAPSLTLLDALHDRWVTLLEGMDAADFARPLQHPERGPMSLDSMLQLYAWHGPHHVAHVTSLRARESW